ncbi:MAG TPA: bifunctional precorrin-2 dehydrogenase/sirohydrochlorin ferrochelatase [Spirochaetota bacterium]|nr:bifunctional precorrin-2 dehydrogenase/sirohydrochlorin ferrochelatase [Spirochaetota bacterium]HPI89469.1 bifunctional precorrin-2 dehydrogenase/sirohydrochlorin ferrochelatase [Spirochaetota bacterium]HPR49326.1 bifunctional precorrin-2 dehydrogenase/sirohydrochlorin ferrochelatase [Spirochaetota bacterium]
MYYPVMLNLSGKRTVVVGGGEVACRKVRDLLDAGALVTVISPEVHADIEKIARENGEMISIEGRKYEPGDLRGASLVFSATDDSAVNREVFREAEQLNIFINAVDDPDNCSFIVPSSIRRGDLIVAVSTSGASPSLAAKIRKDIEKDIPSDIEPLLVSLRKIREILKNDVEFIHLSSSERGEIMKKLTSQNDFLRKILSADDSPALKTLLREIIESRP